MTNSNMPDNPGDCPDCARIFTGEFPHLRLRPACPTCGEMLLLNDRYTIARKLSGNWDTNAEVFVVFDNQELHVQKVLKVLTNQATHVLEMFKIEQTILMELDHTGIPKGYDAFEVSGRSSSSDRANNPGNPDSAERSIPCVVMEKISGETLQDYLNSRGPIDQETAIDWMKQLVNILGYIHSQRLFHRDIKLTNIMRREDDGKLVLIDFGTSRHITQTIVNGGQNTVVFSYGYTAPEQLAGKAEMRSDFYALGRTLLHLLMGELPSEWNTFTPRHPISGKLLTLLKNLTEDDVKKRPKDAQKIIRRLKLIENEPRLKQWKRLGVTFLGGAICGSLIMTPLLRKIEWEKAYHQVFPVLVCDSMRNDRISCGEEMLIRTMQEGKSVPEQKEEGIKFMREGRYREAYEAFKVAFAEQKDPETLIYLNNAKINADPALKAKKVTIAAVIPIGKEEAKSRAMAILRGIAQAQNNAVTQLNLSLEIVIIDDNNTPAIAQDIAKVFTKRQDILAVVGHSNSEASIEALPIYQEEKLVFIAPASTSEELSSAALEDDHIFFRSLASNRINAMHVNRLLVMDLKQKKVAIYYNPGSAYSRSLASAFREASEPYDIEIIDDPNGTLLIANDNFDPKRALKYARDKGATTHILIPDAGVSARSTNNAFKFVAENQGKDWIVAGDSLAGMPEYLDNKYQQFVQGKMIFSAAWDVSNDRDSPLIKFWHNDQMRPDRITQDGSVDWRTYTSYNATWILATALNDSAVRTRIRLQKKLASPTFKATALGTEHQFRERSGELANPSIVLTTIANCGGDRLTTVNFHKPICPNGLPANLPNPIAPTP